MRKWTQDAGAGPPSPAPQPQALPIRPGVGLSLGRCMLPGGGKRQERGHQSLHAVASGAGSLACSMQTGRQEEKMRRRLLGGR